MLAKVCSKCNQNREIKFFCRPPSKNGRYCTICKICQNIYAKEWGLKNNKHKNKRRRELYDKNKEIIRLKQNAWREKNREHVNFQATNYRLNDLEKFKEMARIRSKKEVYSISDNYVKLLIKGRTSLRSADIPEVIVKCYRELLKFKREIKSVWR